MIALLLALQVPPVTAPTLGPIGRQALPAHGCAAFLWSAAGDRALVAMAVADPAHIRLAIDGAAPTDLAAATAPTGDPLGFAGVTQYRGGDVVATLDMTVVTRADISGGATVPQATISVERAGHDTLVLPAAGLIGCAPAQPGG